jgi:hypothetical protein
MPEIRAIDFLAVVLARSAIALRSSLSFAVVRARSTIALRSSLSVPF